MLKRYVIENLFKFVTMIIMIVDKKRFVINFMLRYLSVLDKNIKENVVCVTEIHIRSV